MLPALKPGVPDEGIYIFARDKVCLRSEIMFPKDGILANKINVYLTPIHDKTGPIVVEQKKSGIGFPIVLDAELDELLLFRRNAKSPYNELDYAVITKLGEYFKLGLPERNGLALFSQSQQYRLCC